MGYVSVLVVAALWAVVERMRPQALLVPVGQAVVVDGPPIAPVREARPEAA